MYRFLLLSFSFLFVACSASKEVTKMEEEFYFHSKNEEQEFTFHTWRNGKLIYKGIKGVPKLGRTKTTLPDGMSVGLWAQIDDVSFEKLSPLSQDTSSNEKFILINYKFVDKEEELRFSELPKALVTIDKIFQALLKYP